MTHTHKQRTFVFDDYTQLVDEGVYSLVAAIFKLGLRTVNSCEGRAVELSEFKGLNNYDRYQLLSNSRASIILDTSENIDEFIQLFIRYSMDHPRTYSLWTLTFDQSSTFPGQVLFRLPNNELEGFAWYIHDHITDAESKKGALTWLPKLPKRSPNT